MSSQNSICCWDFTCTESAFTVEELKEKLNAIAKKWSFQLEQGEKTDYRHYQGRVSLKDKTRNMKGVLPPCRWSPTSNNCKDDEEYVTKDFTRIGGPWRSTDRYIPRQIREIEKLRPWQQYIVDHCNDWDTRSINYVYCPEGNTGKSTLCGYIRAHGLGRAIPPMNDMKDIMRMICDTDTERLYTIDLPRFMKKDKLNGFYSGIEMIKDGYAYDDRYNFKEKIFDCPNIWIFSNSLPQFEALSLDRWKVWLIRDHQLVRRPSVCNILNKLEQLEQKEDELDEFARSLLLEKKKENEA